MAALNSSSTDTEVWAAYDDNASYEEDQSRAKCLAFITACRILLRRRPSRAARQGLELQFDAKSISDELVAAQRWLNLHPAGSSPRTRFASFENFRD
jgi:hypothetical protein